jgi:hypothetical protein
MKINSKEELEKKVLEFILDEFHKESTMFINRYHVVFGDLDVNPAKIELMDFYNYKRYEC